MHPEVEQRNLRAQPRVERISGIPGLHRGGEFAGVPGCLVDAATAAAAPSMLERSSQEPTMMSPSLRCALHAFSILFALLSVEASSRQTGNVVEQSLAIGNQAADEARIPVNLVLIPALRPVVERMWHESPTFKAQCARLRQAPSLLVDVRFGNASQLGAGRGRTDFRRSPRHTMRAEIYIDLELRSVHQLVELIAHELEHVIEQLDEVELTPADGHGVYLTARGAFETARALHIGQTVAREIDDAAHSASPLRRR